MKEIITKKYKRPNLNGKWIKDKELRLGHRIIPCNPRFLSKIDDKESENQPYQLPEVQIPEISEVLEFSKIF